SKHGTGCVLSAALIANLAMRYDLEESCINAKKYVEKFIISNKGKLGYH
ncbi:MAG: bifunctional hydroxymethylpyrimidine kinase/phosphomethylpyrimidine kinase, partial [Bacteroidota bacterium]